MGIPPHNTVPYTEPVTKGSRRTRTICKGRQPTRQGLSCEDDLHGETAQHRGRRSDLSRVDPAAGFARGKFNPATGYQLVQDVFRLYADAIPETPGAVADPEKLQRYYKARDALQLQVIDPDGNVVPETTVHVYERAGSDDALELEVHIADVGFWRTKTDDGTSARTPEGEA